MSAYHAQTEVKEWERAYRARPEFKKRMKEYNHVYLDQPGVRARNKARMSAYHAQPEVRERTRNRHLKCKYGLTTQEVDTMIAGQNGLCFLCRKLPKGDRDNARLGVDHCHKTGKVRAMLCSKCNSGLGFAHDDPTLLRKMATYIEAYR